MKNRINPTNPIRVNNSKAITMQTVIDNGAVARVIYDKIPDECPICHRGVDTRIIQAYMANFRATAAQVIFQCPRSGCLHFFIGYYFGSAKAKEFYFLRLAPITPIERDFGDVIASISPQFVDIYNEASYAENLQLAQICGVGYRKALEFLIKDYAISLIADEKTIETIKSKWLDNVINEFIDSPHIQDVAKRATWLGNDETHYVRKWEDKDINDLKTLIELTVRWIEMVRLSKDYKEEMP